VRAEFVAAIPISVFVGGALIANGGVVSWIIGAWLVGVGINYVPLAWYAIRMSDRTSLEAELVGLDLRSEIRRYTKAQLWITLPFAIVIFALAGSGRGDYPRPSS
jgi:hypothetical protein